MTITFFAIFIVGAVVLVRGRMFASKAREAWTVGIMAVTATVVGCQRFYDPEMGESFVVTIEFNDARGQPHTVKLPGPFTYRQFEVG
jgi:hypothetical protein